MMIFRWCIPKVARQVADIDQAQSESVDDQNLDNCALCQSDTCDNFSQTDGTDRGIDGPGRRTGARSGSSGFSGLARA